MRSPITHTLAAFVLAAIPAAGLAQSQAAARANPAAEHLAAARAALNKVLNAPAPSGEAFKKLSDLKTEYIALEKSASTASPDWATHYSAVDRLAGELIGASTELSASAPAAPSGEPGAVGTSGQTGAMKGVGPEVAADLSSFRSELKAFSTAMSAVASSNASASSTAAPDAAAAASSSSPASAPAAASPAPSAPPSATATSGSVAPSPTPAADTGFAAQIDPVIALVDGALKANPADASGKVTIDRATLDAIKAQLQVIKAKKQ